MTKKPAKTKNRPGNDAFPPGNRAFPARVSAIHVHTLKDKRGPAPIHACIFQANRTK